MNLQNLLSFKAGGSKAEKVLELASKNIILFLLQKAALHSCMHREQGLFARKRLHYVK